MMNGWLLALGVANVLLTLGLLVLLALHVSRSRRRHDALQDLIGPWLVAQPTQRQHDLAQAERQAQALRSELHDSARGTRQELSAALAVFQQTLLQQNSEVARSQNDQIDSFRTQLAGMQRSVGDSLMQASQQVAAQGQAQRDTLQTTLQRLGQQLTDAQHSLGRNLTEQLALLGAGHDRRQAELRQVVEQRLATLQQGNEQKLEQMRLTVDEKLHATLEQRLGDSFRQVADRLEQVHQGLGEMKSLARDVGSLNRVLNNVKSRGIVGEVQLAGLLEQVFTPEQYAAQVETVPGSGQRVDFAVRLPGRPPAGSDLDRPLWLPIDAKFPREDHERLLDAQERADAAGAEAAARAIEQRLRAEARSMRDKYLAPPHTTDFGILFVPTESLYAEALRRPGLVQALQAEHKVTLAGPTTLLALLTSLQMGFRSLALEKRSAEVWEVLGAVKTEFGKFGDVLAKTKKKLDEASQTIDQAAVRTRVMQRQLRSVEALPEHRAAALLAGPAGTADAAPSAAGLPAPVPASEPVRESASDDR